MAEPEGRHQSSPGAHVCCSAAQADTSLGSSDLQGQMLLGSPTLRLQMLLYSPTLQLQRQLGSRTMQTQMGTFTMQLQMLFWSPSLQTQTQARLSAVGELDQTKQHVRFHLVVSMHSMKAYMRHQTATVT